MKKMEHFIFYDPYPCIQCIACKDCTALYVHSWKSTLEKMNFFFGSDLIFGVWRGTWTYKISRKNLRENKFLSS